MGKLPGSLVVILLLLSIPQMTVAKTDRARTPPLNQLRPVVPLGSSVAEIPLLRSWLKDSDYSYKDLEDAGQVERVEKRLQSYKQKLAEGIGQLSESEKLKMLKALYEGSQQLVDYYDRLSKTDYEDHEKSRLNLRRVQKDLLDYSFALSRLTKDKETRYKILYTNFTTAYFAVKDRGTIIPKLIKIRSELDRMLQTKIDFLSAVHLTFSSYTRRQGITTIQNLMRKFNDNPDGIVVARFALARARAGLDERGRETGKADGRYRKQLAAVMLRAVDRPARVRSEMLSFAVGVWRRAAGRESSWKSVPFGMNNLRGILGTDGIHERQMLQNLTDSRLSPTIDFYTDLFARVRRQPLSMAVHKRILMLEQRRYQKTGDPGPLFHAFTSAMRHFKRKDRFGPAKAPQVATLYSELRGEYGRFVLRVLDRAGAPGVTRARMRAAIKIGSAWLSEGRPPATVQRVRRRLAALHHKLGEHDLAVRILLNGAGQNLSRSDANTLKDAVRSLMPAASWPADPPWTTIPSGSVAKRKQLLKVLQAIHGQQKGKLNWKIIGHIGLLHINLGNRAATWKVWSAALDQRGDHPFAGKAAGVMLTNLARDKKPRAVVDLVRRLKKKGIRPRVGKKAIPLARLQEDAWVRYSRRLAAAKEYRKAAAYLYELINDKSIRAKDEHYWELAELRKKDGQTKGALHTLRDLLSKFPKTKYRKRAIIKGSQWGRGAAQDDYALLFSQLFIKEYPRDKKTPGYRLQAIDILLRHKAWKEAAAIYKAQRDDPRVSASGRIMAAREYMLIHERYGNPALAAKGARILGRLGGKDHKIKGVILGFQARRAHKQGKPNDLVRIEGELQSLNRRLPEVVEALSFTRMSLASLITPLNPARNLKGVRGPKKRLDRLYKDFASLQAIYDSVCSGRSNRYCAPAKYSLGVFADRTMAALENVTIPATFDRAAVNGLNIIRQQYLSRVGAVRKRSLAVAIRLAREGATTARWKRLILAAGRHPPGRTGGSLSYLKWNLGSTAH